MRKLFLIGIKDLKLIFRDRAALIFMLLAPFLLTIGMGFVTGRFSGNSSGLSDIPVIIVNLDKEQLGNALADVFSSEELADLMEPTTSSDPEAARRLIDEDKAAAAVIIPAGFTRSIIPAEGTTFDQNYVQPEPVRIEVYTNPSRPTTRGLSKRSWMNSSHAWKKDGFSGMTSLVQLMSSGLLRSSKMQQVKHVNYSPMLTRVNRQPSRSRKTRKVQRLWNSTCLPTWRRLWHCLFLMYTVSYGGRSILAERSQGTLPRLLVSPTSTVQVFGGKVLGIFFTGVAQVGILILASSVFFGVKWGDVLGLVVLILAAVFGATGWGMLITALSRSPAQVGSIGSALMLIFGILGGSFINLDQMPAFRANHQQDHTQRLGLGWISPH